MKAANERYAYLDKEVGVSVDGNLGQVKKEER